MTFAERVDRYWDGLHVAAGPSFGCGECNLEDVQPDDAGAEDAYAMACDPHFAWSKCPSCGGLAGDRHAVHFWSDDGSITGHEDVCQDCLCYIANGDVPDDE